MAFPPTVGQYFPQTQDFVNKYFLPTNIPYMLMQGVLIVIFTYATPRFSSTRSIRRTTCAATAATSRASGLARRQRSTSTASRTRLTLPGAIYLALVATLPTLFIRYGGFSQATAGAFGGTSVLIAVGVALDTMRQMESQMMARSYEGFLRPVRHQPSAARRSSQDSHRAVLGRAHTSSVWTLPRPKRCSLRERQRRGQRHRTGHR